MKTVVNLKEFEALVRKCAEIRSCTNTYTPCDRCVLISVCQENEELNEFVECDPNASLEKEDANEG